ncbi:acylphosphatase [Marinobacterium lutimaris]|uniref:Acylphosphatase n=1 Tax=Marinobacterium lutimaris TaxID=568106 RepID=A0A1H5WTM8_9GAMM|nr:acylphosphatase [Marinobacterium lutimaris]SEG02804.1 acylphosphatase [Marinobacterium lutimaris]
MSELCARVRVSGRVQGVSFRRFTQQQAQVLGATGWVRNLPDGSVEAMICGEQSVVEQVLAELRTGPDYAQVDRLEQETLPMRCFHGFIIRYDQ